MPGKHAPTSPRSYYLSLGRAAAGVVGAIALVVVLAVVAFGNRGPKAPTAARSTGTPSATPTVSSPPLDSATPTPTPSTAAALRAPSQITVSILNGTSRGGLASRTRTQIVAAGYRVIRIGNASNVAKSTIYYAAGFAGEASAFQQRFPGFTVIKPADSSVAGGVDLTLVLGSDYAS